MDEVNMGNGYTFTTKFVLGQKIWYEKNFKIYSGVIETFRVSFVDDSKAEYKIIMTYRVIDNLGQKLEVSDMAHHIFGTLNEAKLHVKKLIDEITDDD